MFDIIAGTIIWELVNKVISALSKKHSSTEKMLLQDIDNLIEDWLEEWEKEEKMTFEKYAWWNKEIEKWVQKLSDEKPISDKDFDELFHWSICRVKSLSNLILKQVEWYESGKDLFVQMIKEKDALLKQLEEDLNTYFSVIFSIAEKEAKKAWVEIVWDIEKANEIIENFKEFTLNWVNNLIQKIIDRIKVN